MVKTSNHNKELDNHDLAILRAVQTNGRISVADLAKAINLSATPCAARLRRLEKKGFIAGYHARLNPQALAQDLLVFMQVSLSSTEESVLTAFNEAIRRIPQIQECHMVGGGFDYLMKIRVRDMAAFRAFLGNVVPGLPEVENTHSYFVMEQVKEGQELNLAKPDS